MIIDYTFIALMMMNVISFSYLPPAAAHLNKGNTQISQHFPEHFGHYCNQALEPGVS